MNTKIINSNRYKKTTKDEIERKKKISKQIIIAKKKAKRSYEKKNLQANKIVKRKRYIPKMFKVILVVFALIIIGFLARFLNNHENFNIMDVFSKEKENVKFQPNYNFNLGISKLDTTNKFLTRNVILNELLNTTTSNLIDINKDYSIKYKAALKIEKVNNIEYIIELAPEYELTIDDIKSSIQSILNSGSSNIYFQKVNKIDRLESINKNNIKVFLKQEDPYFIYNLDFPIYKSTNSDYIISDVTSTNILFKKNNSKSTLDTIALKKYEDSNQMVSDFNQNKLDAFVVSSDAVMQLIGKHEYNIKKYRDGETVFILGNKSSKLFLQKEVRQAIAYSINREEIVKQVNSSFSEVIDLPFIYSNIKYKYDIYGASNILLSNGWKKSAGVYKKNIDSEIINLELKMLVNSSDVTKTKIANLIKEMLESNGIKLNIVLAKENELNNLINSSNYDIILSSIYINNVPDISLLNEYLNINDQTNMAFNKLKESNIENIGKNINDLENELSNQVACIGIMARNANVVYQKDISIQDETLGYMKVFENIEKIGKKINLK
ncbi:MAG: ABC transporter substrate-binding protein [Clostridia bacterium]